MTKKDLSPEKQKEYDEIVKEMMEDIEKRQANQKPLEKNQLSCSYGNAPYVEVQKIYFPRLQALFNED